MKYDIIIVLCPSEKIKGKFPEFLDGKYLGGQARMDAAVELYGRDKGVEFILVGGYKKDDGTDNYKKSQKTNDMKSYMLENGVDQGNIKVINSLPCTKHNLVTVFNTWKSDSQEIEETKKKTIGLLTNFYHLPRALRFWKELIEEKEFQGIPTPFPISAESVVKNMPAGIYVRFIEYFIRLEGERTGFRDIEGGEYCDSCLGKNFKYFKRIIKDHFKDDHNVLLTREETKLPKIKELIEK